MADPLQVCEAIIERLTPVMLDWHLVVSEPQPPKFVPLPYAVVETVPAKGADYVQVMGDWAKWFIQIVLNSNGSDHEASLRFMAPYLDTSGPIHKALKDTMCDYDDTLTKLSNGVVLPATLTGFKIVRKRQLGPVRTATITVGVGSN